MTLEQLQQGIDEADRAITGRMERDAETIRQLSSAVTEEARLVELWATHLRSVGVSPGIVDDMFRRAAELRGVVEAADPCPF